MTILTENSAFSIIIYPKIWKKNRNFSNLIKKAFSLKKIRKLSKFSIFGIKTLKRPQFSQFQRHFSRNLLKITKVWDFCVFSRKFLLLPFLWFFSETVKTAFCLMVLYKNRDYWQFSDLFQKKNTFWLRFLRFWCFQLEISIFWSENLKMILQIPFFLINFSQISLKNHKKIGFFVFSAVNFDFSDLKIWNLMSISIKSTFPDTLASATRFRRSSRRWLSTWNKNETSTRQCTRGHTLSVSYTKINSIASISSLSDII